MANMTFKADLIPEGTSLSRSLGTASQKWKINGVADPKLTDTVTDITTSGSGNAVTSITCSNGQLTVNKSTTFLTSHQDISGKVNKSGDTMTGALTISSGNLSVTAGNIWAGTNGDTTAERDLGVQSGAGQLYLYSAASATGNRGLYTPAHGTGSSKSIILVDTNNNATFNGNASTATTATNATNIYSSASTSKAYVLGTTTASSANHATVYNASVYTQNSVLYGACWNDYAEYRITNEKIEPGRCVIEVGNDNLILSKKRLQPGAEIVSDTFGFAIGETLDAQTPIAVTGRVLAYPYETLEEFRKNIGKPVCSGPDGTVSIMTDKEYQEYGYCAIGTISAVPSYNIWGSGNIKVNNRVWIRIR